MQLKQAVDAAYELFIQSDVPSPRMNAELLLMFTLGCDRAYLYGHPERVLTAEEQSRYDDALSRRSQGIPAQYITGRQEFWGMDLIVSPAVLIPRPETEHVIETVLEFVRHSTGETPVTPQTELAREWRARAPFDFAQGGSAPH